MNKDYELIIIGAGVSGSALLYEISKYANIKSVCLIEKYHKNSTLNSNSRANSQTIHCGDIETNYTLDKAKKVKRTSKMVEKYCLQYGYQNKIMFKHQKMAIGIGYEECNFMMKRYEEFKEIYPYLEIYDKKKLEEIEPAVIFDKNKKIREEDIVGIGAINEYTTVNFEKLSDSFLENAKKNKNIDMDIAFNTKVDEISKENDIFTIKTSTKKIYKAKMIIVDAGAYSLYLAHKMGYGLEYSQIPIGGSFYKANARILHGKVYMVQNPKLPFAALHGDPDLTLDDNTRFGPTALILPTLERFKKGTFLDFISTLKIDKNILKIFYDLIRDKDIRNYLFKNFLFEIPFFGKLAFLKDARKIVPSLQMKDIQYAKGFGGIRAQILDKKNRKLMLGEASINTNEGIIFNMTPSPGATSCLGNAKRDVILICKYLNKKFDIKQFEKDLEE